MSGIVQEAAAVAAGRTLAQVLAWQLVAVKPGRDPERMDMLNRIYANLPLVEQIRCRRELLECRAAKRGERAA